MTTPGPDWADRAARFLARSGLADSLIAGAGSPRGPGAGGDDGAACADKHPVECRWCPLCAGLAALRGRRPDLLESIAGLLDEAATVIRAHAATPAPDAAPDGAAGDGAPAAPPSAAPPVQRIVVA